MDLRLPLGRRGDYVNMRAAVRAFSALRVALATMTPWCVEGALCRREKRSSEVTFHGLPSHAL
jgi:hypothetical protein